MIVTRVSRDYILWLDFGVAVLSSNASACQHCSQPSLLMKQNIRDKLQCWRSWPDLPWVRSLLLNLPFSMFIYIGLLPCQPFNSNSTRLTCVSPHATCDDHNAYFPLSAYMIPSALFNSDSGPLSTTFCVAALMLALVTGPLSTLSCEEATGQDTRQIAVICPRAMLLSGRCHSKTDLPSSYMPDYYHANLPILHLREKTRH